MLERLVHEPRARKIGQPLLTLSSLNKINFNLILTTRNTKTGTLTVTLLNKIEEELLQLSQ